LAIVIMAAGKGTRLKSRRPKVLHAIGGKPLLGHVIAAAAKVVDAADIYVIVGHESERVRAAVAGTGVKFVEQAEQLGTGHAIKCAAPAIAGYDNFLVLSGDAPLIRPETIALVRDFHAAEGAAMTLLSALPENSYGYGRVLRKAPGSAEVASIVEEKAATAEQKTVREINSGMYGFRTSAVLKHLGELRTDNPQAEYYLTDMAAILGRAGERVVAVAAPDANEILGANTIAELVALDAEMRRKTAARLMALGVTIFKPETCVIDAEVEIGPDTVVEPGVQILGASRIGSDCLIRTGSILESAQLADNVLVRPYSLIVESTVGAGAKIGPFAHVRPGSEVGEEAHVGNFVEIKKVKLGQGAKANHLTYLGDAEVGAATNIGAGVITCNYDGVNKHLTQIGAGVFVGSDSTLVAPLTVGDGAYIGAGSCITQSVPGDALAVGRSRQVIREGWAVGKRARLGKKE
jgi:bifunctional UDP-N-acetylglucosamine pyrophosphorylase/glucosamine-1-phosphate N-acetyltransferase